MIKRVIDTNWFFISELFCISLAVAFWYYLPGVNWQPLLIVIAPISLQIISGKQPFVRTSFDLPIMLFLLTAGIGLWATYQHTITTNKFWLILASIVLYYLLSRQPVKNLWIAAGILCFICSMTGIYYFLCSQRLFLFQQLLLLAEKTLASIHISLKLSINRNLVNEFVDAIDLALPFSSAFTYTFFRRKAYIKSFLFALVTCLILATALLSDSKSSGIAMIGVTGLFVIWKITGFFSKKTSINHRAIFIFIMAFFIFVGLGFLWANSSTRMIDVSIGGKDLSELNQRLHLYISTVELIKDVPFTGGGLNSFPGLYSTYILSTPNFIVNHSHNIYLDVSLEQGILGGIILAWIYFGSVFILISRLNIASHSILCEAILTSLLIIIIHGLFDTTIYTTQLAPLLFFVPGMAVGYLKSTEPELQPTLQDKSRILQWAILILTAVGVILLGIIAFRKPLLSAWYTNLGAVEMAKVELSDFPTNTWDEGEHARWLSPAEALFEQALTIDPENPRAHYRLGLIAVMNRNYLTAISHLEKAYEGNSYHRGIIKALGLSYLWNGQVDKALPLLSLLPESNQELAVYSWWWGEQGRPDLAGFASEYVRLASSKP